MLRFPSSVFPAALLAALCVAGCSESKPAPASNPPDVRPIQGIEQAKQPRYYAKKAEVVEEEVSENVIDESDSESVESAFDSNQWNTAVGLGGGSGRRGGRATPPLAESSRESYSKVVENAFLSTAVAPISTFGVDVDTASYTNVRRFLNYGQLPPAKAVRIEELINYFRFDYPQPGGKDSFSVTMERGTCPWNRRHQLVLVGLQGKQLDAAAIPPRNLVFLIDVSGSMSSADKLPLVKRSLVRLTRGLTEKDTVAIVTYAGEESVALEPTNCKDTRPICECIEDLGSGGSTNGAGGIRKAYELARVNFQKEHANRVILVTDGDFNVGLSDTGELRMLIEKERESGVFLTVVGVGTGNLQDDKMSTLAKHGNGQYLYLDGDDEAKRAFEHGLTGTLVTIAKDVKLQVEFNPGKVAGYRLLGYERRVMQKKDFRNDKKDSGEIGAGHSVTALYEVVPSGVAVPGVKEPADLAKAREGRHEMMEVRLRYKAPHADKARESRVRMAADAKAGKNLQFASAVAAFGLVLSESAHAGNASFELARELTAGCIGEDELRAEFLELTKTAAQTKQHVAAVLERRKAIAAKRMDPAEVNEERKKRLPTIRKGLEWLASRQREDGSWADTGKAPVQDVGITGLALLALSGNGSTMRSGPDKDRIKAGIKWLRRQQNGQGLYTTESSKGSMLDHTIAAFAMTEVAGLSRYKTLTRNVLAGRDNLVGRQGEGSVQTLGWQALLWESLNDFGWSRAPGELLVAASKILQQPSHEKSFLFERAPIVLIERFVMRGKGLQNNEPVPPEADRILALDPTTLETTDAAAFFFGARAMEEVGGLHRKTWHTDNWDAIRIAQNKDGTFGPRSRIYDTALLVLALEEPFRRPARHR